MNKQKIIILVFILTVLAQLFVPAKMIYDKEKLIQNGKEFLFRIRPVDPSDPFKGKYITLYFDQNTTQVAEPDKWEAGEKIYVSFTSDNLGFAKIKFVSHTEPDQENDFLTLKISYINDYDSSLVIDFPFNKYYMEESKAAIAEQIYREIRDDKTAYALIYIKNGEGTLSKVFIDDIPIEELVKKRMEENRENE